MSACLPAKSRKMGAERIGPLELDVVSALTALADAGRLSFEQMTVAEARAAYRAGCDTVQWKPVAVAEVIDLDLGLDRPLPGRLYRPDPSNAAAPAILFFHGGGWVIGDLDTHDSICRKIAVETNRTVLAVDYRLGPEHRFSAASDDALTAHATMIELAASLRIDPADIVVCGDSAGGTLAVLAARAALVRSLPVPSAALLFYPVADLRGLTASYRSVTGVPLTAATMAWFRVNYLNDPAEASDWRGSPLLAPSFEGFPPTFLTSAGHDPLCDEAFLFADRLRTAGTSVEHRHLPGQIHGYLTLARIISEAERSLAAATQFLTSKRVA